MKISTKGRYGVRAILDLALHAGETPVDLKEIAQRQNLSRRYLERLFAALRDAGIVASVRGAQGGFHLARDPESISMLEVVEALEGPLQPVDCLGDPRLCPIIESCVPHDFWSRVSAAARRVMAETTLADLAEDEAKRQSSIPIQPKCQPEGAERHV
jgi:Rrf2 family protein